MSRTYTATYTTYYTFHIPKDVVLIKEEDQVEVEEESPPGYWWVKWGTFYYIDKNGKQHEIEGERSDDKWPDGVAEPDEDEEAEEDEEDDEDEEDEEDDGGSFVTMSEPEEAKKADGDGFVVCEHCGEGGGAHASEDCPHYEFVECCDTNCACAGHWYKKNPFEDDESDIIAAEAAARVRSVLAAKCTGSSMETIVAARAAAALAAAAEDDEDAIDYSKLNHIKTTPGGVEIYA